MISRANLYQALPFLFFPIGTRGEPGNEANLSDPGIKWDWFFFFGLKSFLIMLVSLRYFEVLPTASFSL